MGLLLAFVDSVAGVCLCLLLQGCLGVRGSGCLGILHGCFWIASGSCWNVWGVLPTLVEGLFSASFWLLSALVSGNPSFRLFKTHIICLGGIMTAQLRRDFPLGPLLFLLNRSR